MARREGASRPEMSLGMKVVGGQVRPGSTRLIAG